MSKPDGGLAFPFWYQGPTTGPEVYYGMTLRDWFAGQALAYIRDVNDKVAARRAYGIADAMLRERES